MPAEAPPVALTITEVRVRLNDVGHEEILKAYASITLNSSLAVHNLKIIQGARGLFVSMPARRNKSGGFSDIVHPVNQEFRDYVEAVVIGAYWREQGHPVEDGLPEDGQPEDPT